MYLVVNRGLVRGVARPGPHHQTVGAPFRVTHSQAWTSAVYRLNVGGRVLRDLFLLQSNLSGRFREYSCRYRRSLNHKLCRLGIGRCYYFDPFGTLREIKVFGFWGEYGRKAET